MTKGNESSRWLAHRCVFLRTGSEVCDVCAEGYGMFWSNRSRKHCEYCGCQMHSKCSVNLRLDEEGKARMCQRCYTYKFNHSHLLTSGEEFIAYTGKYPSASYLCLSEDNSCLLLTIDPSDVEEKIVLSEIINIQRGFSHAGHMKAASLYDPLRCFSITTNTPNGLKAYDLKAESLSQCEQWITLLKSTLQIYQRISDQEQAALEYTQLGETLPITGHLYFPVDKKDSSSSSLDTTPPKKKRDKRQKILSKNDTPPKIEILEEGDMVVVETVTDTTSTSRETTPSSEDHTQSTPIVRKAHYKIRTLHTAHSSSTMRRKENRRDTHRLTVSSHHTSSSSDWRLDSSTSSRGLPYKGKRNPLASNCSCHAYAIEPSRTFLYPLSSPDNGTPHDPFKTCCELCRGKCRVVHDLTNF